MKMRWNTDNWPEKRINRKFFAVVSDMLHGLGSRKLTKFSNKKPKARAKLPTPQRHGAPIDGGLKPLSRKHLRRLMWRNRPNLTRSELAGAVGRYIERRGA